MSALTIEQIIKLILGIAVVVVVIIALYFVFKTRIMEFFNSLSPEDVTKVFLVLIK
jgi:flagellar biosynthesis/type III secretory pathway M-ring protein FliF/YscJ